MVRHVSEADSIIQYEIAEVGSEALFLELRTLRARGQQAANSLPHDRRDWYD